MKEASQPRRTHNQVLSPGDISHQKLTELPRSASALSALAVCSADGQLGPAQSRRCRLRPVCGRSRVRPPESLRQPRLQLGPVTSLLTLGQQRAARASPRASPEDLWNCATVKQDPLIKDPETATNKPGVRKWQEEGHQLAHSYRQTRGTTVAGGRSLATTQ